VNLERLIKKYLGEGKVMQIATVSGEQPWICTVYYVCDDGMNLYWLSFPTRRHSQEIAHHDKAAVAVAVKTGKPVIGVQAEGIVEAVKDKQLVSKIMELYVKKYNTGQDFYKNFIAGKNEHWMYKFTPKEYVLFDELDFPKISRQEWKPKK
jgi:uncharacterized protein YhbP (UPF0306 family)